MSEIEFPYAGDMPHEGVGTWPVGECSVCGALVLDKGSVQRKHAEHHQLVDAVLDVVRRYTDAAITSSMEKTVLDYYREMQAVLSGGAS